MSLSDFSEMLGAMARGASDDGPQPIPEAVVHELRGLCQRYAAGCPFKPGDLVTPRPGYNKRGAGDPHIVLEVADSPHRNFVPCEDQSDTSSAHFGARLDVRVGASMGGDYVAFWAESWVLEPYAGPTDVAAN